MARYGEDRIPRIAQASTKILVIRPQRQRQRILGAERRFRQPISSILFYGAPFQSVPEIVLLLRVFCQIVQLSVWLAGVVRRAQVDLFDQAVHAVRRNKLTNSFAANCDERLRSVVRAPQS